MVGNPLERSPTPNDKNEGKHREDQTPNTNDKRKTHNNVRKQEQAVGIYRKPRGRKHNSEERWMGARPPPRRVNPLGEGSLLTCTSKRRSSGATSRFRATTTHLALDANHLPRWGHPFVFCCCCCCLGFFGSRSFRRAYPRRVPLPSSPRWRRLAPNNERP